MKIMRKFIRYYRPYWKVFLFDMICAMGISVIDLAFPQILNYLNATLYLESAEQIKDAIVVLLVILLVMYTVRALCKYYVSAQGHIMGAMMERDMRKELFDQYERLSFSYYDRNNTGEMMSRLVSDLFDICEFAHHGPENVFISLLKIIGSFILLMYIHVPLTILLMIVTIGMLLFSLRQNRRMQETFMENRRKIAGVNASLQDTLAGIRVVKSFANEQIEQQKFARSNEHYLTSKINNYHCMGRFQGGNNFFQGLLYVDPGRWSLVHRPRHAGAGGVGDLCAVYQYLRIADRSARRIYGDAAERIFPASSGSMKSWRRSRISWMRQTAKSCVK